MKVEKKDPVIEELEATYKAYVKKLRSLPYKIYLKTYHWRERIRTLAFVIYGKQCVVCNSSSDLHVHHKDYLHRGEEEFYMESVTVLCEKCHKKFHGEDKELLDIAPLTPKLDKKEGSSIINLKEISRKVSIINMSDTTPYFIHVLSQLERGCNGKPRNFTKRYKIFESGKYYILVNKILTYIHLLCDRYPEREYSFKGILKHYLTSIYEHYGRYDRIPELTQFSPSDGNRYRFEKEWVYEWEKEHDCCLYWGIKR